MGYFKQLRYDYILECLEVYGYINRKHLIRKFGISNAQAGFDLSQFARDNSSLVKYNLKTKRYEHNTTSL